MPMVDVNWLRWLEQGGHLGSANPVTSSAWSGSSASKSRSVEGRWWVEALVGEEVRVAGGDDAVDGEPAGGAVVGVEAVALPRVVAEHDVGAELTDHAGHRARWSAWPRARRRCGRA